MNKQIYQEPTINVSTFECADVIRTSTPTSEEVGVTWASFWEA